MEVKGSRGLLLNDPGREGERRSIEYDMYNMYNIYIYIYIVILYVMYYKR